ncbi:hypothetical protein E8M24_27475 [Bacillus thuringiensis]|uniref:hypothetical protein n=1 Tax=Bacillus thuringiensis TaxID=1428 RepID=UPI00125FAF70|nr:hypothetical protein [Bacillus thuringiensis]KAB5633368.1 hypothetical protein E8M24_27475 [Bacillus thuringiensis]HDR5272515.1 hypothetical protein [Bacillus thuringiensis]HDR7494886.1 hypothetical protein [Bacillus cereus]
MKWLINLYPKKWRKRYGDEFLYILENRKLSLKEVIDVCINAMDARFLNVVEGIINMEKKVREMMLHSVFKRFLIIVPVIFLGLFSGYFIANYTPSISELTPKLVLLIGVGLGVFVGYVVGLVRGIMRVITVTQKEDVFLPTGKLKFDKLER